MESQHLRGGGLHRGDVEGSAEHRRLPHRQRVPQRGVVRDPVGVAPPDGGEARIERARYLLRGVDDDVRGAQVTQHSPQPADESVRGRARAGAAPGQSFDSSGGQIAVDDLAARVHPRVRASGDHGAHGLAAEAGQALLDEALDGAQLRLDRPAVEVRPVVAQVDAEADRGPGILGLGLRGRGRRGHCSRGRGHPGHRSSATGPGR